MLPRFRSIVRTAAFVLICAATLMAQRSTLLPTPAGIANFSEFGSSMATLRDASGAARFLAIGAPADTNGGQVHIYDLQTNSYLTPLFVSGGGRFGASIAAIADRTGDGIEDLIIGAPERDIASSPTDSGFFYLYNPITSGGASGQLASFHPLGIEAVGTVVGRTADMNGDGFEEHFVTGQDGAVGVIDIYSGNPAQLFGTRLGRYFGGVGTAFGRSAAGVGDVDGDGLGDIAVGEPFAGFTPGTGWNGRVTVITAADLNSGSTPLSLAGSSIFGLNFGSSVAGGVDWNGNGTDDVFVGAAGSNRVRVLRYANGFLQIIDTLNKRNYDGTLYGANVANVGDLNGDGRDEVAVMEPEATDAQGAFSGDIAVFTRRNTSRPNRHMPFSVGNTSAGTELGASMVGLGDLDGDGYGDMAVGAPQEGTGSVRILNGADGTRVERYSGSSNGGVQQRLELLTNPTPLAPVTFSAYDCIPGDDVIFLLGTNLYTQQVPIIGGRAQYMQVIRRSSAIGTANSQGRASVSLSFPLGIPAVQLVAQMWTENLAAGTVGFTNAVTFTVR